MTKNTSVTKIFGDQTVIISSPDKIYFPKDGQTKIDLINYYAAVAEPLLATMGGRPTLVQRFPNGVGNKSFFQKRLPKGTPDWISSTTVSTPNGTISNALVIADLAHVAWAANMGCLGFHPWPFIATDPDHCDELRIDLDPSPGCTFDQVRFAAQKVKELLDEHTILSYPKTTGNRGLHIYARLQPYWNSYQVRKAAVALARELERRYPDQLTAAWWKEERGQRIFIDYNQNAPHKTVFGALSVRARVGAQVSTPLYWEEVSSIIPDDLTMKIVPKKIADDGNPWEAINQYPQTIVSLLDLYEKDMEDGLMDAPWPPVYPKQPNEPPRVAPSRAKNLRK